MNLANRIRSEMSQAMSWKQYRDLLIDVLYSSGRPKSIDRVRAVFNADYFGDSKSLTELLIATGEFNTTFANTFRSSGTQVTPQAVLQSMLLDIDANNNAGPFAGAVLGALGSTGAVPTGWSYETASGVVITITDVNPYEGKPSLGFTMTGLNSSGGSVYPYIGIIAVATPAQIAAVYAEAMYSGTGDTNGPPQIQVQSRTGTDYVDGSGKVITGTLSQIAHQQAVGALANRAYFLVTAEIPNGVTAALTYRLTDFVTSVQ